MKKIILPKWKTSYTKLDLSLLESCFIPGVKIGGKKNVDIEKIVLYCRPCKSETGRT